MDCKPWASKIEIHNMWPDRSSWLRTGKMAISSSVCWMPTGSFGLHLLMHISAIKTGGTSEHEAMNFVWYPQLPPPPQKKKNKHLLNHWTSCKISLRLFQSFCWLDFSWNMVSCFLGSVQEFEWFFLGILTCTWFYRFFGIPTNTHK